MSKNTRYLGLDVHTETITAAIAEGRAEGAQPGAIAESAGISLERLHRKFTKLTQLRKPAGKVPTAVGRELVGFVRAIPTYERP